jgi:Cu(I)/Ag(I) efflux system protein CusF
MKIVTIVALALVMALCTFSAVAVDATSRPILLAQAGVAEKPMTDGEVKKVDKDSGKLTIKHGPLPNLDMPSMTMVFRVKDPAMLDHVKEGDKIRFVADRVNGAITIVELKPVK